LVQGAALVARRWPSCHPRPRVALRRRWGPPFQRCPRSLLGATLGRIDTRVTSTEDIPVPPPWTPASSIPEDRRAASQTAAPSLRVDRDDGYAVAYAGPAGAPRAAAEAAAGPRPDAVGGGGAAALHQPGGDGHGAYAREDVP